MAWYNPTDPTQRNWMVGGLIALILIVPFRMYVWQPIVDDNAVLQGRLEALDAQNRQAGVILARGGADLEARMQLYERHVARLEQLIPAQEEVPALIDDVQLRARDADVLVTGLDPEPTEPAGPYNRTGYSMTVVGDYHNIARFLTEVASLQRIVTPVQLDMQVYQGPNVTSDMESPVQATFRIETYVLPDQATVAPAELPGG